MWLHPCPGLRREGVQTTDVHHRCRQRRRDGRLPGIREMDHTVHKIVMHLNTEHRFHLRHGAVKRDFIPAVRNLRMEVVMIPWLVLTTLLVILLIYLWLA